MLKMAKSSSFEAESLASPAASAGKSPGKSPFVRLVKEIEACRICRDQPRGSPLPHEPRPVLRVSSTARLLIAGQAPGTRVHASGIPFTDPSGDRLRDWMGIGGEVFYDNSRVAIIPMGFCFPGLDARKADLPPRAECRTAWHDRLMAAMPQVETILVIGNYARDYHFERLGLTEYKKAGLTEIIQCWRDFSRRKPLVIPLPHPSWRNSGWLKKNPWFEIELLPVLRAEVARLLQKP